MIQAYTGKPVAIRIRDYHGLTSHPLYKVWSGIKCRCLNENNPAFNDYGGRGISMYWKWKRDFICFYDWCIENGWKPGLEIDRNNNDLGYNPNNCSFVTGKENCRNRRTNVIIEYNGKSQTLIEWAEETGINYHVLHGRLKSKWSLDRLFMPPNTRTSLTIGNKTKTISQWADILGIPRETVCERYRKGVRGKALFFKGNVRSFKS